MKKTISFFSIVFMAGILMLTACGKAQLVGKCQDCGEEKKLYAVHFMTYKEGELYNEVTDDDLCMDCIEVGMEKLEMKKKGKIYKSEVKDGIYSEAEYEPMREE